MRISDWSSDVCSSDLFSRIHVDDIASGVIAAFDGPSGAYNLADDMPAPQNEVVEFAARLLGVAPPEVIRSEEHTSELQSLMSNSYAVFCLKKNKKYLHPTL